MNKSLGDYHVNSFTEGTVILENRKVILGLGSSIKKILVISSSQVLHITHLTHILHILLDYILKILISQSLAIEFVRLFSYTALESPEKPTSTLQIRLCHDCKVLNKGSYASLSLHS